MRKLLNVLLVLVISSSVIYSQDFNLAAGKAQSHQTYINSNFNTLTFSLGVDYLKKTKLFLRSNLAYQLYKIDRGQAAEYNFLALNTIISFPFHNDNRVMLYFGPGLQTSFVISKNTKNINGEIKADPVNIGLYAQLGGYLKWNNIYLGLIADACYYFGGVGDIESEKLPGVGSAQYISIVFPIEQK